MNGERRARGKGGGGWGVWMLIEVADLLIN